MAYSDSIRQQYATFTTTADLIDNLLTQNFSASFDVAVVKGTSAASNVIEGYLFSNSTDPFQLNLNKSRGASLNVNTIVANGDVLGRINFVGANGTGYNTAARIEGVVDGTPGATNDMPGALVFRTCADGTATATERMRITNAGNILINASTYSGFIAANTAGLVIGAAGDISLTADSAACLYVNRKTDDGALQNFYQDATLEGSISVAGDTVTYGAFCGSHWTQLEDGSKPEIPIGTIMESIDELCEWPGENEERLPKVKISDVVKSSAVYGVFMGWDNDWMSTNDMNIASLGAYFCRVPAGTVLSIGDLLESDGNGMAQKQADDIIRSSTIGKVTATIASHYEPDGSFCIPTVLFCG